MNNLGGKKTCKYYATCGNKDNCSRCQGYEKRKKIKRICNYSCSQR